jgi:hypothetical protein
VESRIGLALRVETPWIVGEVILRIPAPVANVLASREGDGVVDDDELLVVTGSNGVLVVEAKVDALVFAPG